MAVGYAFAWSSADENAVLHDRVGRFILVLLVLRGIWGLVGTRHARFRRFVTGPRRALAYAHALATGRPPHFLGHNPLGGWMVVALIGSLVLVGASGVLIAAGGEAWEEIHEAAAGLSAVLVGLHLAGVVVSSLLHRENLVGAMITGTKRRRESHV